MPESISAATNQVLITGRKDYVWDGTNWRPMSANTAGAIILGAGTAAAGTVAVSNIETIQTELLAITSIAASVQQASTILSLTGIKKATVFIDHGRAATAAFAVNGTEYRVEVSQQSANNDTWRAIASVLAGSAVAVAIVADADEAVGQTVIECGTAVATRGDLVFWANTVSAASSEWMRVVAVSGTVNFTIQDGLRYAQDSDTNIYTQAEQFVLVLDTEAITRMRVIVNNNASSATQAIYSRIACITES